MSLSNLTAPQPPAGARGARLLHSNVEPFIPKSIVCLREGYGRQFFFADLFAGLTVATGMHALDEFYRKCKRQHTRLLLAGVHAQPMFAIVKYGLIDKFGEENLFGNIDDALGRAREIVGVTPQPHPTAAVAEVARERK